MRLDKYLKVSRLVKRRTIANEMCDAGKILVNGKVCRASYSVKVGDVLELSLGEKKVKVEILNVMEFCKKENVQEMYKVILSTNVILPPSLS